ncbi:hypothetical protein CALK_0312 [Chitinivibrio alkaliphilus ACht1]|uniref:Mutual gliding-motility protein MglA n=1 Tax=Chitinivibrio alkaliphilus ACht1 TaxID=1313304 RepID=U7D863_9BACT|nr:GTPase domain-containing protein [Chitinivibrio alkaliphilus]ERP39145.1 hypothetical protein CALK_0312 [Chitinivibrio alkaliphilus ACht1]
MATINYAAREINVKIVYYGPALSGKTTNLQIIHQKTPDASKSDMVSLATEADRTLFFDFLPIDLGKIRGFTTKIQLYTVPGQVYYNATRKLVLRGVDGIVFVADSAEDKMDQNIESLDNMEENLAEYGYDLRTIPVILQFNKRDIHNALPVEYLNQKLNRYNTQYQEAIANKGKGVFETLKVIGKRVIDILNQKYSTPNQPGLNHSRPTQPRPLAQPKAAPKKAAPTPRPQKQPPPAAQNQAPQEQQQQQLELQRQIQLQQQMLEQQKRQLEEQQRMFEQQRQEFLRQQQETPPPPSAHTSEDSEDLEFDMSFGSSTSKTQEIPVVPRSPEPPQQQEDSDDIDLDIDDLDAFNEDLSLDMDEDSLGTDLELEELDTVDSLSEKPQAQPESPTELSLEDFSFDDDSDDLISSSFLSDDAPSTPPEKKEEKKHEEPHDAPLDVTSMKPETNDSEEEESQLFFSTIENSTKKAKKKPINPKYKKNFLDNLFNK